MFKVMYYDVYFHTMYDILIHKYYRLKQFKYFIEWRFYSAKLSIDLTEKLIKQREHRKANFLQFLIFN